MAQNISRGSSLDQRTVSSLLDKMVARGLLEATVMADGEHVITATRLRLDVEAAVDAGGGRASSAELAAVVGVDETAVRTTLGRICKGDSKSTCIEYGGLLEILTPAYFDSLANKAETTAMERGRVTVAELSSIFKLPIDLTEEFISARMDDPSQRFFPSSRLVNGALLAAAYESTKISTLRAVCSAASQPCTLEELMQACDLPQDDEEFAIGLMRGLVQSGEVQGSLTAGRPREYVPDSFVATQHEAAYTFFAANGYLDQATAATMQVRKLHAFVQDKYPNAEYLETVVVSRGLVEQLEAVADEAVAQGSWFEAWTVLPTFLSDADAALLVEMCAGCKRAADDPLRVLHLAGVYGVSAKFIEDIVDRFRRETMSSAKSTASASSGTGGFQDNLSSGNGGTRRGGGKGPRRKGGRKAKDTADQVPEEEVRAFLLSCRPELDDHPRLVLALSVHLALQFRDAKIEAIRLATHESFSSVHKQADAFDASFENSFLDFQLHCRGVQALRQALRHCSSSPAGSYCKTKASTTGAGSPREGRIPSALVDIHDPERRAEAYLVETRGAQLAAMVTTRECEKLGIAFASQDRAEGRGPECMPVITKEACSALLELLPRDVGKALANLWQAAMAGSQLSAFCGILEEQVFPACNLVGRRLDKRRERGLVAKGQLAMKEKLFKSTSEEDILHCAILVVFESVTGGLPLLPQPIPAPRTSNNAFEPHGSLREREESWSAILLKAIGDEISPEARDILSNLQRDIQVSETATPTGEVATHANEITSGDNLNTGDDGQPRDGEDAVARLMRSAEAARALGLAFGE